MVQLNTTYDSSIHQKIFVLRGDEAYARTTDTIATLITDFDNYSSYISKCHVGLEIQVLRELGESTLHIYCDDEEIYAIPWVDSGMAQVIDSDWNDKGVYWEDGKLIIGKYDYENHINTGLFLLYDVEHMIKIRYDGNKRCLGSKADPIIFTVPTPDTFATELTFNKVNPRYAPDTTIDDVTLTLTCQNELTSSKMIDIYDDSTTPSTLLDTVELEQDTPLTVTLSGLSDGLHNIRASWNGDYECYGSETTMNVSMGYKITQLEYPSMLISGNAGTLSCTVLDYFNNPYVGLGFAVVEYIPNWGWETISPDSNLTDGNGFVSIDPVYYSSREFAITDGNWYGDKHTTNVISPSKLQVAFDNPISDRRLYYDGTWGVATNNLTVNVLDENNQKISVGDIPLTIRFKNFIYDDSYDEVTDATGTYTGGYNSKIAGLINTTVTVKNTQVSETVNWIVPEYWWSSSNNKQVGTSTNTEAMVISKVSNGFKFKAETSGSATARFLFNPNSDPSDIKVPIQGIYSVEFDCISYGSEFYLYGEEVTSNLRNKHIKILHNLNTGVVKMYADGNLFDTITGMNINNFPLRTRNGNNVVIDNLVIVREQ